MKKYLWILAAVVALVACGKNEKPGVTPVVTDAVSVTPTSLSFTADGTQTESVSVTASGAWTSAKSASWITVNPSSGNGNATVTVSAAFNGGDARTGKVTFKVGSASAELSVSQSADAPAEETSVVPAPAAFDGTKRSNTAYQLLIYSFADSDGDGVGDFKGIQNKLDYLDGLGITALWLSPAHPTSSYHAYDVNDYYSLNPNYGTEQDFKDLLDAAHAKGIAIYMDYVLNHSGTGTEWFKSVKADPKNSPYRDYYVLSNGDFPDEAIGGMGGWKSLEDNVEIGYKGRLHFKVDWTDDNNKYVTVTETTEPAQSANTTNAKMWIHVGSAGSLGMYETSSNIYEITLDVDTNWGFLVRSSNSDKWPEGTKYGGRAPIKISFGQPFLLNNSSWCSDIVFGDATHYYASFDSSMPDLNYGNPAECQNSRAFKSTVESAVKWLNMGLDGFRLDAVKWIYGGIIDADNLFLDQWYQAVNKAYKDAGHSEDIFVVGEAWEGSHDLEKLYYNGLISCFEFDYAGMLSDALNRGNGLSYVTSVMRYVNDHAAVRPDAITSLFLTNHDQDRWAEWIGKSLAKEKQSAAMLLTSPGKPFIYQGEELGYYGTKGGGDEYVRSPIVWNTSATDCAKKWNPDNKLDNNMLKGSISVETQQANKESLLNVYITWSRLRNTYPALAEGTMSEHATLNSRNTGAQSIAAWYMTSTDGQKLLVIHNVGSSAKSVTVSDDLSKPIALLGTASVAGRSLKLGANSSVVFQL